MSTNNGGLSRRRGAGGGGDDSASNNSSRPTSTGGAGAGGGGGNHGHRSSVDGGKVHADPRDLQMEDENKTQPRRTLMEEVLLLGLKDKQVTTVHLSVSYHSSTSGSEKVAGLRRLFFFLSLRSGEGLFCYVDLFLAFLTYAN
jgi:hypothetical protein